MCTGWYKWMRAKRKAVVATCAQLGILFTCRMNSNKTTKTKQTATMTTYLATHAKYDKSVVSMKTATASHARPHDVNADATAKMTVKARLVGYLRGPIMMARRMCFSVSASVGTLGSSLFRSQKRVKTPIKAGMVGAKGSVAIVRENAAVGVSAGAACAVAMSATSTKTEMVSKSARLRWWFNPEIDENGSLYIQQAHTITQIDNTLEVR